MNRVSFFDQGTKPVFAVFAVFAGAMHCLWGGIRRPFLPGDPVFDSQEGPRFYPHLLKYVRIKLIEAR